MAVLVLELSLSSESTTFLLRLVSVSDMENSQFYFKTDQNHHCWDTNKLPVQLSDLFVNIIIVITVLDVNLGCKSSCLWLGVNLHASNGYWLQLLMSSCRWVFYGNVALSDQSGTHPALVFIKYLGIVIENKNHPEIILGTVLMAEAWEDITVVFQT